MKVKCKILDHIINEKTLNLLNNVKIDFPNEELLIHPLLLLEKETGLTPKKGEYGKYVISSDYIPIYIKQDVNDALFNVILSHELLHHYQVMNSINVISDVNQFCKWKLKNIRCITDNINEVMMDIDIYYKQKLLGYNLIPWSKKLNNSHVDDTSNIEGNINLQNVNTFYFMAFYRCWFINEYLYLLDDLTYKNDIKNFYANNLSDNNWTLWRSLLSFSKKYPPCNTKNYDNMLKVICDRLLKCRAYLKKGVFRPKKINLILFDLIPRNKFKNDIA